MRRLDWQLVQPHSEEGVSSSLPVLRSIHRLVAREARDELDEEDRSVLFELEATYRETTTTTCAAVSAPRIASDPGWQSRAIDEYAELDTDLDLEEYLELRQKEPDCERCPYVSPYGLYPMNPCEFGAGALEQVLTDADLARRAAEPMDPVAMVALATALEAARDEDRFRRIEAVDAEHYLSMAAHFLRFWADAGFGVLPTDIDELIDFQDDEPMPAREEEDGEPTTYH